MAKKGVASKEPVAENKAKQDDLPRSFSKSERVIVGTESSDKDLFAEVVSGKQAKPLEEHEFEGAVEESEAKTKTGVGRETEIESEGDFEEDIEVKKPKKKAVSKPKPISQEEQELPEKDGSLGSGESDEFAEDDLDEYYDDEEFDDDLEHELGVKEEGVRDALAHDEIKKTILHKAAILGSKDLGDSGALPLNFLEDEKTKSVFIGRKRSVFKQYGLDAALFVGRVNEAEHKDKNVFLDGLNPHVVFICGARGSGKCLTGDALIPLETGEVVQIKDLADRTEKVFALNHELKINGVQKTGFFKRTVYKILKIKLKSGKEIKLTPEHPLLTVNGWRPAEELQKGDRIATPRVIPTFGNKIMKECDVKLLAYLIAEGHLSNEFVLFSNFDEKITGDFKSSVFEFDPNLRIEIHSKEGCFRVAQKKKQVDISNLIRNEKGQFTNDSFIVHQKSSLVNWLIDIGLYGKLSASKFIPKEIVSLEKRQLSLFLNRLFSCDGSIYPINKRKNWAVSIGFSSEKMTRQVSHLLSRFGIISTFRKKMIKLNSKLFENFEVVLYGENVIKFITEIGFFGKKEEKMQQAMMEMLKIKRNPNNDTVPKEIWGLFKVSNWKKMARQLGYAQQSFHNSRNYAPSRGKLLKMAQIEGNKGVELLADSDIYWDPIVVIEELNEKTQVYDITVPEVHNFVANDIIVHNSYALGIIAEELALQNKNVGTIMIDPIGVFWSMRYPNKEKREVEKLAEWNLKARGLDNIKVFIPMGMTEQVPKSTYDSGFAMLPSLLTGEDWTLTFSIDRFSVTGLLLDQTLKKVEKGYKEKDGGKKVAGKGKDYSLDDIINCLKTDSDINSREAGYKQDSIRALASRFEAAKTWGIFNDKGTPLGELSREGQLTILDTSFLDDNVTALVIGVLARRILAARKISTRKEVSQKFKSMGVDQMLELEIPPTWLIVDEAHTLIPSGNEKTPASVPLIEYAKQGRRPGCSLVFATQQPSAIDTKVLSQLDVILTHKLVFDDDVKAVNKRTPTIIPGRYRKSSFIKTLPVGVALTGDRREETTRAFVMEIRPRYSQHEGRDVETSDRGNSLPSGKARELALELVYNDVLKYRSLPVEKIEQVIASVNAKYNAGLELDSFLDDLKEKKIFLGKNSVSLEPLNESVLQKEEQGILLGGDIPKAEEEIVLEEKKQKGVLQKGLGEMPLQTQLLSLPQKIDKIMARQIVDSARKKKVLGFFGSEETVQSLDLKHITIWAVKYEVLSRSGKEFLSRECFINSLTGEFIHFVDNSFIESKGLKEFFELDDESIAVLRALEKSGASMQELVARTSFSDGKIHRILTKLAERNLIGSVENNATASRVYGLKEKLDLPPSERHDLLGSIRSLPFVRAMVISKERELFSKKDIVRALQSLWKNVVVKDIEEVYRPVWEAILGLQGNEREIIIDGLTGKIISVTN